MIVELFIPCYVDQFQPQTARNTLKVLQRIGCGVNYNIEQTCCGRPAFEDGYRDACKEVGEKLIREFQENRYVVSAGSGCVDTVRNQYPALFHNSSLHNEYKFLQRHFYELSDFLVGVMNVSDLRAIYQARAVVFPSCYCKINPADEDPQMALLSKVRRLEIIRLDRTWQCCGAGGGLDRKNEGLAVQMGSDFLLSARDAGADTIISNDPLCLMHLQGVIHKKNLPLKTEYIANVLASGWD